MLTQFLLFSLLSPPGTPGKKRSKSHTAVFGIVISQTRTSIVQVELSGIVL
jgi:hypothetical protein